MTILQKLQIMELLFKGTPEEEINGETVDAIFRILFKKQLKRQAYRELMVAKYGEDVFKNRAKKLIESVKKKGA